MAICLTELIEAAKAIVQNGDANVGLEDRVRPAYDLVNFSSMHDMPLRTPQLHSVDRRRYEDALALSNLREG